MSSNLVLVEMKRNINPKSAVLHYESASFIRLNVRCLVSLISFVNAAVCKISQYNCHFMFRPQFNVVLNYKTIRKFKIANLLCCAYNFFFALCLWGKSNPPNAVGTFYTIGSKLLNLVCASRLILVSIVMLDPTIRIAPTLIRFSIKLDWSVYSCLTQLCDDRKMYRIY